MLNNHSSVSAFNASPNLKVETELIVTFVNYINSITTECFGVYATLSWQIRNPSLPVLIALCNEIFGEILLQFVDTVITGLHST